uniref:Uncharacterized protein n=1 Tax=Oryza glumipatula TaxID=40148 RepID=A0A0E0AN66_9ORYZ
MVQVSNCEVVSCPAKKKVLHSAMISSMLSCGWLPPCSGTHASNINPSSSISALPPFIPNSESHSDIIDPVQSDMVTVIILSLSMSKAGWTTL